MRGLRWVFLLACVGCVALVAWNGRWEGRLTQRTQIWIVNLSRAPIWAPPDPTYATFQEDFKEAEGFPAEGTPGLTVERVLKVDWLVVDLLLYLWPTTVVGGLVYLAIRGKRRDLILHLALSAGIGLTTGAAGCIGTWLLIGGWGPSHPEFFGGLGLVGGIVGGLMSLKRTNTDR